MVKSHHLTKFFFLTFLFFLPWQTRLIWQEAFLNDFVWEYGRFSLYGSQFLLWATLVCYGVWLFQTKKIRKVQLATLVQKAKHPSVLLYWLVVAFLLVAGLSVTWALGGDLAYIRWITLVEAITLFSMVVVFPLKFSDIAVVWVGSSIAQSIFAIYQFFVQYTFSNKWLGMGYHDAMLGGSVILQTANERWMRAYGALPHPNILAGFLAIGLLLAIYLAFVGKNSKQRIFAAFGVVTITAALFFTFSRSAWVGVFVALFLLLFWLMKSPNRKTPLVPIYLKSMLFVLLIISALGITMAEPVVTRLQGIEPLEVSSIQLRFTFTEQAFKIFEQDPMFGAGIGNYTLGVYQYINATWPGYYYQPVHNVYLLILAELGMLGSILFGMIVLTLLWWTFKSTASVEKTITSLALIAILVMGLFDHFFWTSFFGAVIFWVILGLNVKQLRQSGQ